MTASPDARFSPHVVSERIGAADEYEDALETLLEIVRPVSGCESAMVRLLGPEGWAPAYHSRAMTLRFIRDEGLIPSSDCMCGRVARGEADPSTFFFTEKGSFVTNDVDKLLKEATPEELGNIRGRCVVEGFKTLAVVPIRQDGQILGVLHLASKTPGRIGPGSIEALEAICERVGGALVRAEFGEQRQRKLAETVTQVLLPPPPPVLPGLRVGFAHRGAEIAEAVGGDFYEIVEFDEQTTGFVVGDFAGHGIPAAGLASRCRLALRDLLRKTRDPAEALTKANEELCGSIPDDRFCTAAVVVVDLSVNRAYAALAGHPSPIIVEPGGWVHRAEASRPPLGTLPATRYEAAEAEFANDASLVLYTDGLVDARDFNRRRFGHTKLAGLCRSSAYLPPKELAEKLCIASDEHSGGQVQDDKLVLVVQQHTG